MASIRNLLPKPKNSNDKNENDSVGGVPSALADYERQKTLFTSTNHIPPYGKRQNWRPTKQEDFGDGGAYPECHIEQYPLGMGKDGKKKSNALSISYDNEGKVDYGILARRGHNSNGNVHTSYKDLIPLKNQPEFDEQELEKPTGEEIEQTAENTKQALDKVLAEKLEQSRPRHVTKRPDEPTYVRYKSGDTNKQRIIRVQDFEQDPMAPPRFKRNEVPDQPESPPPPQIHSPPRKATKEEKADWYIPPAVSNWKNPKGFAVAIDKRATADGRGFHDNTVSDKRAAFAEALYNAEVEARKGVRERAAMRQKIAEKENAEKEEKMRELARQAREERKGVSEDEREEEEEEEIKKEVSEHSSDDETAESQRRAEARIERRKQRERELKKTKMGTESKARQFAKEHGRDISERVALGLAKPTLSGDSRFDSRLFNKSSGPGYNEDQLYDKSLFSGREAINSIYQTRGGGVVDTSAEEQIANESRFDSLGKAKKGFKGSEEMGPTEGPVEFEKDKEDPHGVNDLINDVKYGLDEEPSRKKRRRS